MNDDAVLYSKYNEIQKTDASYFIKKFLKYQNWKDGDLIVEIGCADGAVSLQVLEPTFKKNYKKFVMCDLADRMLEFAKSRTKSDKIEFLQLDISAGMPQNLKNYFNHAFSFYCLNCIGDKDRHQQALKNISDMLKSGGDAIFTIIVNTPYFDIWENLAGEKKWAPFMCDYKNYIAPYNYSDNPQEMLVEFLEKSGFEIKKCEYEKRCWTYENMEDYMGFAIAVTPFVKIIPEDLYSDFYRDFERESKKCKLNRFENPENDDKEIHTDYTVLAVCAYKK